jgi:hypothetical protein
MKLFYLLILLFLASCNTQEPSDITTSIKPDETANLRKEIPVNKLKEKILSRSSIAHKTLTLHFEDFKPSKLFVFDRYDDRYFESSPKRGERFITSNVTVKNSSSSQDLPCITAFQYDEGYLQAVGTFDYRFYRWQDYGYYLGNYHDKFNDFEYTEKIKFSLGAVISEQTLKQKPIFILMSKGTWASRMNNKFASPPVNYDNSICIPYATIIGLSELEYYEVIDVINPEKLP